MGEKDFKFAQEVFNEKSEIIMAYAKQVLKYEGVQEGLIKGLKEDMQTEKMQIAKRMLKDGESIEKNMRYTGPGRHII